MKFRIVVIVVILLLSQSALADHTVGFLIPVSGLGDQSFNDMTYAGLVQAKNKHGFRLVREKCKGSALSDRRAAMQELINRGSHIIVSNGWEFTQVVEDYAVKYPKIIFVINDMPVSGQPNIVSTVFGQHEGSFLAGALAGWMTKTGKIGFIGGKDMPVIRAFQTGFREGAVYARPEIEVVEEFLSGKDEEAPGFDNPGLAFNKANALYDMGIDIIFGVAGLAGNGIIRSAAQKDKFVIGVDADQDHMAKGNVLTSVMKRLDKVTFDIVEQVLDGKYSSGVYRYGLRENGVALSPMTYTRHLIPQEIFNKLEILRQQVIAGEIKVTDYLSENM